MISLKKITAALLFAAPFFAQAAPTIYAQASKGSSNDELPTPTY